MTRSNSLLRLVMALLASLRAGFRPEQSFRALGGADRAGFRPAIHQSQGVCLLPFGIIEKHGPHLPLGTDLINVRYVTEKAAQQEYAVVFPAYYFGQIAEARQQPGTVSYSGHMQLDLLQETTDEMATQRLQEDRDRKRSWREPEPAAVLRATADADAARLCRLHVLANPR